VVVISIVSAVSDSIDASVIVVARMFRVFSKLMKLIKTFKPVRGMREILETAVAAASSLVDIGGLLFLLMSVYAIVGMKFFWNIASDGVVMTSHVNFRSFGTALLAMFRVATVSPCASADILRPCGSDRYRVYCGCRVTTGTISCTPLWTGTATSRMLADVEGTFRWSSSTRSYFLPLFAS